MLASSYFGGGGDDHITAVAIASDGTLRLAGDSTSAALGGSAATRLAPGNGFVAAVSRDGSTLLWLRWLEPVTGLVLTPDDTLVLQGARHLLEVDRAGGSIVWTGPDLGGTTGGVTLAADGDLGVVAGSTLFRFAPDGMTQRFSVSVGRSTVDGVTADPVSGDLFVHGSQNTNPCGPWRSPFLYRYNAAGTLTAHLYDFPGSDPNVCVGARLLADAHVDWVGFDPDGTGWFTGATDGGDTVFTTDPASTATPLAGLVGGCLATPCYGYVGAANIGFGARLTSDRSTVARASFFVAHFNEAPAVCSCDVPNPGGAVRSNSAGLGYLFGFPGGVVGVGASAYRWPVTANAWYPHVAYTPGYPAVVGVLDRDLRTMQMATMLPGTGAANAAAYRGGRLVVVGNAPDNSAYALPSTEPGWLYTVPPLPASSPLQAGYGGGATDGYLYVACVTTAAECDAALTDGGTTDAGAGPMDATTTDAAASDVTLDAAGPADVTAADTTPVDVTVSDAGMPDAGTPDAGMPDAGSDGASVADVQPVDAAPGSAPTGGGGGCGCVVEAPRSGTAGGWGLLAIAVGRWPSKRGARRRRSG